MEYSTMQTAKNPMNEKENIAKDYPPYLVYLDAEGQTKEEVFMNIASFSENKGLIPDKALIYQKLLDNEKAKGTTAVGYGMALPEAYSEKLQSPFVFIFCRTKNPIDFNSADDKPVIIIVVSLIRDATNPESLRAAAKMTRLLRKESFQEAFLKANDENEVLSLLR